MLRTLLHLTALLAVLLIGQATLAAVDSTDLLIKALIEKQLLTEDEAAAIRADIATTRTDEEAARKSFPVTGKRPVTISGYTQLRYINAEGAGTPSTLEARRVRLTIAGNTTPDLDYRAQLDFAGSRKAVTNNAFATALFGKPVLLDANLGYRFAGGQKLTVGQQKVPFGQENLASSSNFDLINYAQVSENLVPSRDIGAQGYDTGVLFTGTQTLHATALEYALGVFTGTGINTGDDNETKDLAARVAWKPAIDGLTLAADYYDGAAGAARATRRRTGFDAAYVVGLWTVRGEYVRGTDAAVKKDGWYTTVTRRLTNSVQAVARYDVYDPNTAVAKNGTAAITGGVNVFLSKDGLARIQVNFEHKREQGAQVANDQLLAQFQAGF